MNLEELRTDVSFQLKFQSGVPDQDFHGPSTTPWLYIDNFINQGYRHEFTNVLNEAGSQAFVRTYETTWPAADVTFAFPAFIDLGQVIAIYNVTGGGFGQALWVGDKMEAAELSWKNGKELQWGTAGPGMDISLLIQYQATPTRLILPLDTPDLFPAEFHDIIVWSACITARSVSDEDAPQIWKERLREQRFALIKYMSKERPRRVGDSRLKR